SIMSEGLRQGATQTCLPAPLIRHGPNGTLMIRQEGRRDALGPNKYREVRRDIPSISHCSVQRAASAAILVLFSVAAVAQTPATADSSSQQPSGGAPSSPLAIHVGDADLLFGGFIDATAIRRTVNTGSGLGTSFGTIPFGNTVAGHMNDTQFSSQNSRLSLEATSKAGTADLKGSLEVDFLGNAPNGLNVTSNSNT